MITYEGPPGSREATVSFRANPPGPPPAQRDPAEVAEELQAQGRYVEGLEAVAIKGWEHAKGVAYARHAEVLARKEQLKVELFRAKAVQDEEDRQAGRLPQAGIMAPTAAASAFGVSETEKAWQAILAFGEREEQPALIAIGRVEQGLAEARAAHAQAVQRVGDLERELARAEAAAQIPPPPPDEAGNWRKRLGDALAALGVEPPAVAPAGPTKGQR